MNTIGLGARILGRIVNPTVSKANLAVTFACNHKCITCNIWKTHGKNLVGDTTGKKELSVDEIGKIAARNKLIYLSLTGGESFLRKDITEIMIIALRYIPMVTVTTNGSKPEVIEQAVTKVLAYTNNILDINVSLDGNEEQHDAFTRVEGSYKRATETIERLNRLRCGRLRLSIETLVSSRTEAGREHVHQYAERIGVPLTYSIEQVAPFYDNEENNVQKTDLPKVKPSFDPHTMFNYLYIKTAERNGHVPKCVAGQYTCSITPYGDVMACLFMPAVLKNLRDTNYVIGKLDYEKVVDTCNAHCWTPCESYPTILFRPWRLL